jgi:hypothetical protein
MANQRHITPIGEIRLVPEEDGGGVRPDETPEVVEPVRNRTWSQLLRVALCIAAKPLETFCAKSEIWMPLPAWLFRPRCILHGR